MSDQHMGRVLCGGCHISASGSHAGDDSADRCPCGVFQVASRLYNSLDGAFHGCRHCLHTVDPDRRGAYYRPLDRIPANPSDVGANLTGPSYCTNYDLPDSRSGNGYHLSCSLYDADDGISDKCPCLTTYLADRLNRPLDSFSGQIARSAAN